MSFYAHSENKAGIKHDLVTHLKRVAELAALFSGKFGAAEFGYWAGLWHDLGKFHPDFQSFIHAPKGRRGPDHSSAGAVHAGDGFGLLAFLVAGHHSGLPSKTDLNLRLKKKAAAQEVAEALELARSALAEVGRIFPVSIVPWPVPGRCMTILRIDRDSWRKVHESKRQDGDQTVFAKRPTCATAGGEGRPGNGTRVSYADLCLAEWQSRC